MMTFAGNILSKGFQIESFLILFYFAVFVAKCKRRRRIPLNQPKIARFNGSKCVFSFIMSFFECFQRVDIGSLQFIYIVCVLIYFVLFSRVAFFLFLSQSRSFGCGFGEPDLEDSL